MDKVKCDCGQQGRMANGWLVGAGTWAQGLPDCAVPAPPPQSPNLWASWPSIPLPIPLDIPIGWLWGDRGPWPPRNPQFMRTRKPCPIWCGSPYCPLSASLTDLTTAGAGPEPAPQPPGSGRTRAGTWTLLSAKSPPLPWVPWIHKVWHGPGGPGQPLCPWGALGQDSPCFCERLTPLFN